MLSTAQLLSRHTYSAIKARALNIPFEEGEGGDPVTHHQSVLTEGPRLTSTIKICAHSCGVLPPFVWLQACLKLAQQAGSVPLSGLPLLLLLLC